MKLKRLLAGVIAGAMVLAMSTTTFATDGETNMETVTIIKNYEAANPGTASPAETFNFNVNPVSVSDAADSVTVQNMPVPTISDVTYSAGEAGSVNKSKNITVTLPAYPSVGIYNYTITENAGTTAGVTYRTNPIYLKVTVTQGENGLLKVAAVRMENETGAKSTAFSDNTYSAGTLKVSKTVSGNLGDREKYFEFKVTLTGEAGKTYADSYAVTGGSAGANNPSSITVGEETTFWLKHGDTISIANLPYNVTYSVTETPAEGYETTANGEMGTINAAETSAAFTNNKGAAVDTGIGLDSLPYIMILAMAVISLIVFFGRKRCARD